MVTTITLTGFSLNVKISVLISDEFSLKSPSVITTRISSANGRAPRFSVNTSSLTFFKAPASVPGKDPGPGILSATVLKLSLLYLPLK